MQTFTAFHDFVYFYVLPLIVVLSKRLCSYLSKSRPPAPDAAGGFAGKQ